MARSRLRGFGFRVSAPSLSHEFDFPGPTAMYIGGPPQWACLVLPALGIWRTMLSARPEEFCRHLEKQDCDTGELSTYLDP